MILLLALLAAPGAHAALSSFCQQHQNQLWALDLGSDGGASHVRKAPEDSEADSDFAGFEPVKLNDDGIRDILADFGGCGSGGCMSALFAGCGAGQKFFAVMPPAYNDDLSVDQKSYVERDGVRWHDVIRTEHRRIEGPGDDGPEVLTLGWRYRLQKDDYELEFLPSEYKSLLKKAKAGRSFAFEQLGAVAYPRLAENPEDPALREVKQELLARPFALKALRAGVVFLETLPPSFRADREAALLAVRSGTTNFKGLSPAFLDDPAFAHAAVRRHGEALAHFSARLRADVALVEEAVRQDSRALPFAAAPIRGNRKLMLAWAPKYKIHLDQLSAELRDDPEVARVFLEADTANYAYLSDTLKANRELARLALRERGGYSLHFAPASIRADLELLLLAAKGDYGSWEAFPEELRKRRDVAFRVLCDNQDTFTFFSPELKADRELARIAATRFPGFYKQLPKALQEDHVFALEVAREMPTVYMDLPDSVRADKEIARVVFARQKYHWHTAPESVRSDAEIAALVKTVPDFEQRDVQPAIARLCEKAPGLAELRAAGK